MMLVALACAACGAPPPQRCEAFAAALCERTAACDDDVDEGACVERVETLLRCADVVAVTGDDGACLVDLDAFACEELAAGRVPPSCDRVDYRAAQS